MQMVWRLLFDRSTDTIRLTIRHVKRFVLIGRWDDPGGLAMRARQPDVVGSVDRDGIAIHYEVHGTGSPTIVMIPPSPITHARMWKGQVPHLARRHRVVTLDGRGNGRSDRPVEVSQHTRAHNVADIIAVMDAVGATDDATDDGNDRVVLVAHCHANWWAIDVAAALPERVAGLVAIAPGVPWVAPSHQHWIDAGPRWESVIDDPVGWERFTRHGIVTDHRDWVEFFFGEQLVEPHSTKPFEDMVAWAMESDGAVLAASEEAQDLDVPEREAYLDQLRHLDRPVLVIHGDRDICQPVAKGRALAALTGGDLVVVAGGGHLLPARDPVAVNRAISQFLLDRLPGSSTPATAHRPPDRAASVPGREVDDGRGDVQVWTRGSQRRRRVLYVSSPIGLGHARRDVAIARELLEHHPDLQIDWLAQDPVTRVLGDEGMRIHPASRWLASESAHLAAEASGHHLHCFQALRRMDEILLANFMVFQQVIEDGDYDLVVGDEAWDIDHYWHENPELKRGAHVWLTDFVGWLPMPVGGDGELVLTSDYNAEMIDHVARYPRIRDRSLFVGNHADIVERSFGPGLPMIRDWTQQHFDFPGYVTGFTPPSPDQVAQWRDEFGWAADEQVVVVTVGGSGVGETLLRQVIEAYPLARRQVPCLRMMVVAGPRIAPESLPVFSGLEVHGYVDRLFRHLSACDLAVVQGGLTTTMELTAARRPFLYFPLRDHFEQNIHVRHRLDRHRAGRCMDFDSSDPDTIAAAMVEELGSPVDYRPVESDGASRAAGMIAELL